MLVGAVLLVVFRHLDVAKANLDPISKLSPITEDFIVNQIFVVQKFLKSKAGWATLCGAFTLMLGGILGLSLFPNTATSKESHGVSNEVELCSRVELNDQGNTTIILSQEKVASMKLQLLPVARTEWPEMLPVTGRLELNADRIAHVSSLVKGVIREVPVELGQKVERGDVLAYIDSREVGEAKLRFVRDKLHFDNIQRKHQWYKTIHENTMALLKMLEEGRSLSDIEAAFRGKSVGKYLGEIIKAFVEFNRSAADYERLRLLGKKEVIPGKEVIRAEAAYKIAESGYRATIEQIRFDARQQLMESQQELQEVESSLAVARSQLLILGYHAQDIETIDPLAEGERIAYYPIRSPIAGTVISKDTPLSKYVDAEAELVEVADLSSVWLRANIFEKDLDAVRGLVGRQVGFTTDGYPERGFTAKVFSLGSQIDDSTRAAAMLAMVNNAEGLLKPGMFAKIELNARHDSCVLQVPASTIQRHGGKAFVFVCEGTSGNATTFTRRDVQLGRATTQFVEIREGVSENETVVAQGGFALKSEMLSELMAE